ncbi:hypothetical protein SDC9_185971 [bioreactor metagenome]|uniref:Uncharacterized protein n=1 Tax=bioreactor metagenome TaxID=1076179 RepID=A0A645HHL0_9ZZZZ
MLVVTFATGSVVPPILTAVAAGAATVLIFVAPLIVVVPTVVLPIVVFLKLPATPVVLILVLPNIVLLAASVAVIFTCAPVIATVPVLAA